MEDPSTFVSTGFQKPKIGENLLLDDGGGREAVGVLKIPITDKINKLHNKRKNLGKSTTGQRNKDKQNGAIKYKFHNTTPEKQKSRLNKSTRKPIIIKSDELLIGKKKIPKDKVETINLVDQPLLSLANVTDTNFSQVNDIGLKTNDFNPDLFNFTDDINLTSSIEQTLESQIDIFLENIKNETITQPQNDLNTLKNVINPDDLLNDLSDVCDKFDLSIKPNKELEFVQVSNETANLEEPSKDEQTSDFLNGGPEDDNVQSANFEIINAEPLNVSEDQVTSILVTNEVTKNNYLAINIIANGTGGTGHDSHVMMPSQCDVCCGAEGGVSLSSGVLRNPVGLHGSRHGPSGHPTRHTVSSFPPPLPSQQWVAHRVGSSTSPKPAEDTAQATAATSTDGDNSGDDQSPVADFIKKINERKKGQFACSECGATFKKQKRLEAHFRYHSESRPHKCLQPMCDWAFTSAYKLARHLETHWGHKKYTCEEEGCNKQFTTLYNLNYHKKLHERPSLFPCMAPDCLQSFSTKKKMEQHLREHKEVEAPYKCFVESCGKPFYSYNILVSHLRIHEHSQEDLTCPFPNCKKRFERMCRLRLHIRGHTGERPYVCDVPGCGWTFVSASKLTRHRKKHTGERKYPCPQCSKCFMRPEHLRGHLVIHSGAKPFACPHEGCPAAFSAKSTLYVHLKKHLGNVSGPKVLHPCPATDCSQRFSCKTTLQEHLNTEHPSTDEAGVEDYLTIIGGPAPLPEISHKVRQENHSGSARTDFCSAHKPLSPKPSSQDDDNKAKDLLSITDGSEVKPEIEDIAKFSNWKKKDAKSKMLITTALEFKYLQQIVNCQTSAEMWKKLSTIYELKSETNKYLLQQRFFEYKMNPNDNIATHISKVETLAQQMKDLAWDSVSSEEKTLENLTARLLKEESLQDHWDSSGNFKPDNALVTFSKFNRNSTASNKQQQHQQSIKDKKKNTHCGYCKKKGHWWKECYKRKEEQKGQQPSSSSRDDSCAFSAETSAFLAETKDSWIADSGATDHMTFRREWFSTFEEIPEGVHPVCLGDGKQIYAKEIIFKTMQLTFFMSAPMIKLQTYLRKLYLQKGIED
ncbi:hypothetical protein LAZ67_2006405 [Cordylochernes scorpioides]|uniref:C2H2-type domain-containing protein n=1 Tax=Cordylochernes scorpioides TaxID=51811 RepID=A0ABY6K5H7_9ARAC|nr:hypothetical protein LAZ67_2006405 [Cordylochernes scorpioides]